MNQKIQELVRCEVHKRYQVKRKPRVLCEACWTLWTLKNLFKAQRLEILKKAKVPTFSSTSRPGSETIMCSGPPDDDGRG